MITRLTLLLVMITLVPPLQKTTSAVTDLRVMSFNIRYGTADDGENRWENRKAFLMDTIKAFNPDLLGTQETLAFQRDYLASMLPDHEAFGVGRNDGREAGEMAALYYRRTRFEKLDGGHFWLSETPDQVGSKGWDAALPRMVTWVKLRDRLYRNSKPLVFFNTHFDHRGTTARIESAKLLRTRIDALGDTARVIVTGDFNSAEASEAYIALFGSDKGRRSPVVDAYRVAHPERAPNEASFSNFVGGKNDGPRIDWIGFSRDWIVESSSIDRTEQNGRFPSDHYPVNAVVRMKAVK
ncbi:MAG: endonuclease/exonuclease/phosphatase family protein [Acidobacteriota bacterium]